MGHIFPSFDGPPVVPPPFEEVFAPYLKQVREKPMSKFEVVEILRDMWNEDGTPVLVNRWECDTARDARALCLARAYEAEMTQRTNERFEAREDGEHMNVDGEADPEEVCAYLSGFGVTPEEIEAAMS